MLLPETPLNACGWGCFTTWEGWWWHRKGLKTGQSRKGLKMLTLIWKQLWKDPKMKRTKKPWGGGQGDKWPRVILGHLYGFAPLLAWKRGVIDEIGHPGVVQIW